jgi:chorismate-pyruvate lyase
VKPHDELNKLAGLFADGDRLILEAEHVAAAMVPEPYKALLVHDAHMTVTMERFHGSPVDVQIIARAEAGDVYSREIVLTKTGTKRVVQFGIVQFDLGCVNESVRRENRAGENPLGRVLIQHNVLRHVDLNMMLAVTVGPALAAHLQTEPGTLTYGRLATIFCNGQPAIDLLEISAPLD